MKTISTQAGSCFEGAPRGIQRGRHDPLHAGEEVAQGHTVKSSIFTRFLKGFGLLVSISLYWSGRRPGHRGRQWNSKFPNFVFSVKNANESL